MIDWSAGNAYHTMYLGYFKYFEQRGANLNSCTCNPWQQHVCGAVNVKPDVMRASPQAVGQALQDVG